MSRNKDTRVAREYHESTKHSEISIRNSGQYLDWKNKPRAFKIYVSMPQKKLPTDFPLPALNALRMNGLLEPENQNGASLSIENLAQILFFSAGITREVKYPFGKYYMRAASATGALYPIEIYVVCEKIADLDDGVYHFDPGEFMLTKIRDGAFLSQLAALAGFNRSVLSSPATLIFTSLAWRNAWKYAARSYRHWFWDSGVIAANFLATAVSLGFRPALLLGFADEKICRLLGIEKEKEAPVALAPIDLPSVLDRPHDIDLEIDKEQENIRAEYVALSKEGETDYPIIWEMNKASYLTSPVEINDWIKSSHSIPAQSQSSRKSIPVEPDSPDPLSPPSLGEVILQRGSTRRFDPKSITLKHLSNVLHYSTCGINADFLRPGSSLIDIYLISNAVEGLPSGSYYFDRERSLLVILKAGEFRSVSSYLCLEQELFGMASVVFFLMARLDPILGYLGNRGYRAAQFEAGTIAGKIYLCAYAQNIGASGSTFYDDAVTEFFSPHSKEKSTMIALGIGIPAYKARRGRILAGKIAREDVLRS